MDRYRAAHRPSPAPVEQQDGDLPAIGVVEFDAAGKRVRCHACGRWFGSLNTHLRMHDLDADTYKERYGLARGASLWPPALQAKQRDAALARDLGSVGRANLPPGRPRTPGLTNRLSVRISASTSRKPRKLLDDA